MKTHRHKPLNLHRETLAALTGPDLKAVAGGPAMTCGDPCTGSCLTQRTCPITHCPVTHCP